MVSSAFNSFQLLFFMYCGVLCGHIGKFRSVCAGKNLLPRSVHRPIKWAAVLKQVFLWCLIFLVIGDIFKKIKTEYYINNCT